MPKKCDVETCWNNAVPGSRFCQRCDDAAQATSHRFPCVIAPRPVDPERRREMAFALFSGLIEQRQLGFDRERIFDMARGCLRIVDEFIAVAEGKEG